MVKGDDTGPLLGAIKKYSKYLSILKIKQYFKSPIEFSFVPMDKDVKAKEIKNFDTKRLHHKIISQSRY